MNDQARLDSADIIELTANKVTESGNKTWFLERVIGATNDHPRWNDSEDPFIYGVDAFNFNALPSGCRNTDGTYLYLGENSIIGSTNQRGLFLFSYYNGVSFDDMQGGMFLSDTVGRSIRLVRLATNEELLYSDGQIIENAFTDIDGNVYSGIKIGTQVWTRENLTVTKLANGTAIPTGFNDLDWSNLTTKGYATPSQSGYGLLYNFYAIAGLIVDANWSVPTDANFTTLTDYIESLAAWDNTNVGKALKSIRQVNSPYISDVLKPINGYELSAEYVKNLPIQDLTSFVKKVTGYSLISDSEISRLAALTAPYTQVDNATASGTITLATNTVTNLTNTGTGTFTIAFGAATANKANDYGFVLRIGGTLRTVNWDAGIVWKDGTAPTLAINKSYYFVSSKLGSQYLTAFNTF